MVQKKLTPINLNNQLCWRPASYIKKCHQRAWVRPLELISR